MKKKVSASSGVLYGFGFIGVLVYYLQHVKTLTDVFLGVLKSIIWPALLTYKLFGFLKI